MYDILNSIFNYLKIVRNVKTKRMSCHLCRVVETIQFLFLKNVWAWVSSATLLLILSLGFFISCKSLGAFKPKLLHRLFYLVLRKLYGQLGTRYVLLIIKYPMTKLKTW